ncbi:hypothetical protein ASC75_20445 [Aminobacter sp. DSM 101952]|nr:hypothetical protein ASC75_20445 [Aminobacter sp. DSM 101952]
MSTSDTPIRAEANSSVVARNYAFILVGGVFFPLLIVAHFIARKRSRQPVGFEQSHYQFQYRTTSVTLIILLALCVIWILLVSRMSPTTPLEAAQYQMKFSFVSQIGWLGFVWTAIRAIRGIYLSGANRTIQNSKTLWVWPR